MAEATNIANNAHMTDGANIAYVVGAANIGYVWVVQIFYLFSVRCYFGAVYPIV